jgi:hypothetical protein
VVSRCIRPIHEGTAIVRGTTKTPGASHSSLVVTSRISPMCCIQGCGGMTLVGNGSASGAPSRRRSPTPIGDAPVSRHANTFRQYSRSSGELAPSPAAESGKSSSR